MIVCAISITSINSLSENILKNDLKYHTRMLIQEQVTTTAVASLESLRETYGEVSLIDCANRPEYVKLLVALTRGATARQMQAIWKNLGPYLQAGPAYQELFIDSLFLWGKLCEQKSADAEKLLLALKSGIAGRELNWFRLLLQPNKLSPIVITNFYWQCVQPLSLEARSEYRTIAMQLVPGLLENELISDLAQTAPQKQSIVLQQWVSYGKQTALLKPAVVISKGLPYVQRNKLHWQKLAAELLLNSEVLPYLGDWQGVLVRDLFADISLQHFVAEYIPLYKDYKGYPGLSDQQRAILTGLVSLSTHQLDGSSVQQLHHYISGLENSDKYYAEVWGFLQHFLLTDITAEQHQQMVAALFVEKYEKSFWLSYWSIISTKLTRLQTNELEYVLRLFSYWFALSPDQFLQADQAYVVQEFFLKLPGQLRNIQVQELLDAGRAFENMSSKAASYSWYPVMQELLVIRKKNIVEKGQELMRLMQQRLPNQKANTSEAEQALAAGIERLLRKGQIAEISYARLACYLPPAPSRNFLEYVSRAPVCNRAHK